MRTLIGLITHHCNLRKHPYTISIYTGGIKRRLYNVQYEMDFHILFHCPIFARRNKTQKITNPGTGAAYLLSLANNSGLFTYMNFYNKPTDTSMGAQNPILHKLPINLSIHSSLLSTLGLFPFIRTPFTFSLVPGTVDISEPRKFTTVKYYSTI